MHIQHHNPCSVALNKLIQQGINPIMAKIYAIRGIKQLDELNTNLSNLPHPYTLLGAKEAGEILYNAIKNNSDITIVADYDCDGATSCAVAIRGLNLLAQKKLNINFIVPNRFIHGYGLTPEIVDLVIEQNPQTKILITVDNGISSFEGVEYAKAKGLIVIITDHHLSSKELPKADVIVNPNQPNCGFISKNIAGVGVIFYVLMAARIILRENNYYKNTQEPKLNTLLDLVALGTVADVVKLDSLNRCFVHNGLQRIKNSQLQVGLLNIAQVAGKNYQDMQSLDLGFAIAPRVNAAGRIDDMSIGITCLISDDFNKTQNIAQTLNTLNSQRKSIESSIKEQVNIQLENFDADKFTICLFGKEWHQGVIGIVASRFKDKYHLPTLIFAQDEDENFIKGSGRSISGFHMRDAIDAISKKSPHIITKFGGHSMAAGLSIHKKYFEEFCADFEEYAQQNICINDLKKQIFVDAELDIKEHCIELAELVQTQVWGQGFQSPLFGNYFQILDQKILKDQHLKLKVKLENKTFDAIWFFHNEYITQYAYIVYELNINIWQNQKNLQLMIKYIKISN